MEFRDRRILAEQAETKQKQQETAALQACNHARDALAQTKTARRLYRLDEKGQRVYQNEAERQAAMVLQMERRVEQLCR